MRAQPAAARVQCSCCISELNIPPLRLPLRGWISDIRYAVRELVIRREPTSTLLRTGLPARLDLDIGGLGVFRTGTSRQKGRLLDAYSVRSATIG